MKRKTIQLVCVFALISLLFSGCMSELGVGSNEIKISIENSKATVTELPNQTSVTSIIIPDEYEGVPVTEIADFAGCNLESVEVISIGKNVESIGIWAFENNQSLKEFIVNEENEYFCSVDGVLFTKDMKTLLFYPPAHGKEYTIPDSVETLRSKAFYKCSSLEKLEFSKNLKTIEEKTFFRCSEMKNVVLPDTLEIIGKDAFGYCSALTEITVPASVKQIDDYAFYNCTALLNVTMKCKEADTQLGKNWYPTNNGLNIDNLNIVWK